MGTLYAFLEGFVVGLELLDGEFLEDLGFHWDGLYMCYILIMIFFVFLIYKLDRTYT